MRILNVFYLFREIMFETVCEMTGLQKMTRIHLPFVNFPVHGL